MAKVDARMVMALRRLTDLPVMECRDLLAEVDGDVLALLRRVREFPERYLWCLSDEQIAVFLAECGIPFSEVERTRRPVADYEVIEVLTFGGHAISDYFLVDRMICSVNSRGQLMGLRIRDDDLARAAKEYLRRIGCAEYPSLAAYQAAEADR